MKKLFWLGLFTALVLLIGCGGGGGGGGTSGGSGGGNLPGLNGRVVDQVGQNLPGATVNVYDNSGVFLGSATTGADGRFNISGITSSAVRFNVVPPAGYTGTFSYNGQTFSNGVVGCYAPLPVITPGAVNVLAANVTTFSVNGPPPPPPTGCN